MKHVSERLCLSEGRSNTCHRHVTVVKESHRLDDVLEMLLLLTVREVVRQPQVRVEE